MNKKSQQWPALELADWQETYAGLHMRTQMLGKVRLARSPAQNHWWHCALYVTAHGLGTSPIPDGHRTFELDLDLLEHQVTLRTSDGVFESIPLNALPVADFYRDFRAMLDDADISVPIRPIPSEIATPIAFDADYVHVAYDAPAAERCFHALTQVDRVLQAFRGRFLGKCSPSHFWWGGFDLACTRFSGRPAPRHPGGIPGLPDYVAVEAYSHECMSCGWWPGNVGGPVDEPAFYAYAYPEPDGFSNADIASGGVYDATLREWILPYEAVRETRDPARATLDFMESVYNAAADLGHWDRHKLER